MIFVIIYYFMCNYSMKATVDCGWGACKYWDPRSEMQISISAPLPAGLGGHAVGKGLLFVFGEVPQSFGAGLPWRLGRTRDTLWRRPPEAGRRGDQRRGLARGLAGLRGRLGGWLKLDESAELLVCVCAILPLSDSVGDGPGPLHGHRRLCRGWVGFDL